MEKTITALKGGMLIDGTGREPLENATVVIEGTKIKAVGRDEETQIPSEACIIDCSGKTIMPGLMDAHMHFIGTRSYDLIERLATPEALKALRAAKQARTLLEAGFTAVRECGLDYIELALRTAIDEGTIPGPRIVACGKFITMTAGHGDHHFLPLPWSKELRLIADGISEVRKAVRMNLRQGVDQIKILATGGCASQMDRLEDEQFSMDEIRAMVETAHAAGRKILAHAEGLKGAKNSISAGIDEIHHGFDLDDEACRMMVDKGIILVPTLAVGYKIMREPGEKLPQWLIEKISKAHEVHIESFKRAHKLGVKIAMGTDFGGPPPLEHGKNALELELSVKYGFSEMEAIVSATKTASEALELDDKVGTIEKGKLADIIIVEGNPLKDIKILQDTNEIKKVIKNGKIEVDRES